MEDEIKSTVIQIILGDGWNYMQPILVPSFAKRIATQMLVTEKLNGRKDFVLRGFVCDIKHKNKVWQLLRIKHEDNGVAPVSSLLTGNIFPTCSNCWLWTGIYFRLKLPGSYWKDKHFWRDYHVLCLVSTLLSWKRGRNFSNILNSVVVGARQSFQLTNKSLCKSVRIQSYSDPHFSRIRTEYGQKVSLCNQSECGKMRARITLNTDSFYAVNNMVSRK